MRRHAQDPDGRYYNVLLNGKKLEHVLEADDEEGWARIYVIRGVSRLEEIEIVTGKIEFVKIENEWPIKILVYATLDREYMHAKALENGLGFEAGGYFGHFNEVPLELTVEKDGTVSGCVSKVIV